MQCPKCGASQPVTNKECSTCGIIFDRWQPRAPRKTTASSTPIPPAAPIVDPEASSPRISTPLIAAALVFLVILGFVWTKHSREARAKTNADDMLNQINNSGAKLRTDLQNRGRGGNVIQASSMSSSSKLPADLDEEKIRNMIESCSFFQSDVSVDIPKRIDSRSYSLGLNRSAALGIAMQQHLIEFDPPIDSNLPYGEPVNVKVTQYASAKVMVSDNGDSYRFGLGRRHVKITRAYKVSQRVSAEFTWTLDQNDAADLAPEGPNPFGGADIERTASSWVLTRVWQKSGGITRYICQ